MDDLLAKLHEALAAAERTALAALREDTTWVADDAMLYETYGLDSSMRCTEHPAGEPNQCDDLLLAEFEDMLLDDRAPRLATFAAAFSPRWVLRQVAAHRKLIAEYDEARAYYDTHKSAPAGEVHGLYTAIKLVAEGYGITVEEAA